MKGKWMCIFIGHIKPEEKIIYHTWEEEMELKISDYKLKNLSANQSVKEKFDL